MEKCIEAPNGVKIYTYRSEYLHSFCLSFYVRAGLLYESDGEYGISHFWEHMVFKNIEKLYGGRLHELLDRNGLRFNACTYKEFVCFWLTGAAGHFRDGADVMSKLLAPMRVDGRTSELEKRRVKREIRESSESAALDRLAVSHVWRGTPLSASITGTAGSVSGMTLKRLTAAHERFLCGDNVFFYVTGAFSDGDIEFLRSRVGEYALPASDVLRRNVAAVPEGFGRRGCAVHLKSDGAAEVRFSFDVEVERYTPEELNLLYDILFAGETSRFYRTMSDENGLIYDFDAFWDRYTNIGVLYFEFEIEQKNLYRAAELVAGVLAGMRDSITGDDLQNVLPAYTDNAGLLLDDPPELNWEMAYRHVLGSDILPVEEIRERYGMVTAERLTQAAREIFTTDSLTFCARCDVKKTDAALLREILMKIDGGHAK